MEIQLRKANEDDLPRLVDLWMEMMAQHHKFEPRIELTRLAPSAYRSYLLLHLRSPKSIVILVENAQGIHGFCCAYICNNLPMFKPSEFGYLSDIYITESLQRQGVGSQLLDFVSGWLKEIGIKCLQLQVYRKNEKGHQFWKNKGFEPYFDRMWLNLDDDDAE